MTQPIETSPLSKWKRAPAVWRSWSLSMTARMFFLVLLAVAPAIAIQAYNEYDLSGSHEAEIRNKTIQMTHNFGAAIGELREGAHQFLSVLSRLPEVKVGETDACSSVLT